MKNGKKLTTANWRQAVDAADSPLILDFGAPWCGSCKVLEPLLDDLAGRHAGKVALAKIDVEDSPEVAEALRVAHLPTVLVFRGGRETERIVGYPGAGPVRALFERLAAG